jgi:hypothetical protein
MASKSPGNRPLLYVHDDEDTLCIDENGFFLKDIVS